MSPYRAERLEGLGFEWDPIAAAWVERFSELVQFKVAHGHCSVPRGGENPELSSWVVRQRQAANNGRMTDEQRRRLEEIGFRF